MHVFLTCPKTPLCQSTCHDTAPPMRFVALSREERLFYHIAESEVGHNFQI
jgi:hypothetical protein